MDTRESGGSLLPDRSGLVEQMRAVLLVYVGVAVVLGLVFVGAAVLDHPVTDFLQDPIARLGGRYTIGILSTFGGALWCWAGAAAALAGAVLLRAGRAAGPPLLAAGLLTAALGVDDLLLVHEALDTKFGIPEPASFVAYGLLGVWVAYAYRDYWRRAEFLLAVLAVLILTLSVFVDVVFVGNYHLDVFEDCVKFVGIATWSLFLGRAAYFELLAQVGKASPA